MAVLTTRRDRGIKALATAVLTLLAVALPASAPSATTITVPPTRTATVPTRPEMGRPAYPSTPPAAICGKTALLSGPLSPPVGAVVIPAGDNSGAAITHTYTIAANTTYWFAPGTHTLGTDQFSQIPAANGDTFVGAPGAVLDGQHLNRYAFTQAGSGVTIRYLTIQNFVAPVNEGVVNHDSGTGWTIEFSTIGHNSGAGVFLGNNNVLRKSCVTANGQYGFQAFRAGGDANVTVDQNEISANNTDDWETRTRGCGCSGGAKFWNVNGAAVTNNWVHHNKGVGLWADTNNVGFLFDDNYINDNDSEGVFYELSYNALMRNNTLKRNALVKGAAFAGRHDSFPVGAIYLSESGGDARVGSKYPILQITGNDFEDNWSGVVMWENADRFCNSASNTSGGFCTLGGTATLSDCGSGTINHAPYYSDCRWKTQNVLVDNNDFRLDRAAIGCTSTTTSCGRQAIISNWGTYPTWSPYRGKAIQDAITFGQNNHFRNNRYAGTWRFAAYDTGHNLDLASWQSAPYRQDDGSTWANAR